MAEHAIGSGLRRATLALTLTCIVGVASPALARTESLRWRHPDPSQVAGFLVYWGFASGDYGAPIDVPQPTPDAEGIYALDIEVPDEPTIYVAVRAYSDSGVTSNFSNEGIRAGIGGSGGDPGSGGGTDGGGDTGSGGGSSPPAGGGWSEDFESLPAGSSLIGWIDTGADNSLEADDSLFAVGDLEGNRVLTTSSEETDIHSHMWGVAFASLVPSFASYEISGRLRTSSAGGRLGVTSHSQYPAGPDLYRLSSAWQTGEMEIHGYQWMQKSPVPSCSAKGTGVTPQANRWYRYRFQVQVGTDANLLRAKVWADGASEPAGWQAECVDSDPNRPMGGTVGVWSGASGAKYWDDFQVTPLGGGEEPPPPTLTAPGRPVLVLP